MAKLVSITVAVLMLGLPLAAPLLAAVPCCAHEQCESAFRPMDTCCHVTTLPETTVPARLAMATPLAAPAMTDQAPQVAPVAMSAMAPVVAHPAHAVFLLTPLRI